MQGNSEGKHQSYNNYTNYPTTHYLLTSTLQEEGRHKHQQGLSGSTDSGTKKLSLLR